MLYYSNSITVEQNGASNNKRDLLGWRYVLRCPGNPSGIAEAKEENTEFWLLHIFCRKFYT